MLSLREPLVSASAARSSIEVAPGVRIDASIAKAADELAETNRVARLVADASALPASLPASLESSSFESRKAAVARVTLDAEAARAARLAELQALQGKAHQRCASQVREAERTAAETRGKLAFEIAKDVEAKLGPIVATVEDNPTGCAREISPAWLALKERAQRELGEYLDVRLLAIPFAAAAGKADHVGDSNFWGYGSSDGVAVAATALNDAIGSKHMIAVRVAAEALAIAVHNARSIPRPDRAPVVKSALTPQEWQVAFMGG